MSKLGKRLLGAVKEARDIAAVGGDRKAYLALIHKDASSDYGVSFPDFPGCVTAGKTLDEARAFAAEALTLHIAGMVADGDDIPLSSSLADILANSDKTHLAVMTVPCHVK